MIGAQGFGVMKDSQMKQEAFDFAYSVCTGETDMKMTDIVNSIPADTDNTQWPEMLADAASIWGKCPSRICGQQDLRQSRIIKIRYRQSF